MMKSIASCISLIGLWCLTLEAIAAPQSKAVKPIAFVPFRLDEMINPQTQKVAKPGEFLHIEMDGKIIYSGVVEGLLDLLNQTELHYNAIGHSLRTEGELWTAMAIAPEDLKRHLLEQLHISPLFALEKMRQPLNPCPLLELADLADDPNSAKPYSPRDWITVGGATSLRLEDLIELINEQQQIFCALGWSLFEGFSSHKLLDVEELLQRRQDLMTTLGISKFHRFFAMIPKKPLKAFGQIVKESQAKVQAKKIATALVYEALEQSTAETESHEEVALEEISSLNLPVLPSEDPIEQDPVKSLEIHTKKHWDGLKLGRRDVFAVDIDGLYSVDGNEEMMSAQAEAKGSIFIANKEMPVIKVKLLSDSKAEEVRSQFIFEIAGTVIFSEDIEDAEIIKISEPNFKCFEVLPKIQQQFMVGFIPILLTEGAKVQLGVDLEQLVRGFKIESNLVPKIDGQGFVWIATGLSDFVSGKAADSIQAIAKIGEKINAATPEKKTSGAISVGIGCQLTILEMYAVLHEAIGLTFRNKEAALVAEKQVLLGYGALKGEVFVYADLPIPKWSWPPWGLKRLNLEIFGWPGFVGKHRLIDWGVLVAPSGYKLLGSDPPDAHEEKLLAELANEHQRKLRQQKLLELKQMITEREATVYQNLLSQANSQDTRLVVKRAEHLTEQLKKIDLLYEPYRQDLHQLLKELQQS